MATVPISELPAVGTLSSAALLPVVQSGETQQSTAAAVITQATSFTANGTNPTSRTPLAKMREFISPEDFGAVGDGVTDDLTALTNCWNAALNNTMLEIRCLAKTYATSGALPTINVSGFSLQGYGPSSNHDVGAINGTCIKAITNSGFTIQTVAPTEGASAQRLDGVRIEGISFDGNSKAAKGLVIKSVRNGTFTVYAQECTTTCYELGVVTTLGEACDLQDCVFRLYGSETTNTGNVIQITGNATANVSMNNFLDVDIVQKNAIGIISQNPDNNHWHKCRVFRAAGGSATVSIEWQGGATEPASTRWEVYDKLTTTVAAAARGTGDGYVVPAKNIKIGVLDVANGTPAPTVGTGASVDGVWLTWTPTVTSTAGTITTLGTVVARYFRRDWKVFFDIVIPITTNGTGSGTVRATLPFQSRNLVQSWTAPGIETALSGVILRGLIAQNSSNLDIQKYDATYPGGDGVTLTINGWYEVAQT